jgi:hypothetical protein
LEKNIGNLLLNFQTTWKSEKVHFQVQKIEGKGNAKLNHKRYDLHHDGIEPESSPSSNATFPIGLSPVRKFVCSLSFPIPALIKSCCRFSGM